ncbi:hypothetical protein SLA2020_494750 [Shorea laevis]
MKTNAFRGSNVFMTTEPRPSSAATLLETAPMTSISSLPSIMRNSRIFKLRCNLLGPWCVLTRAKENKALPKQRFTCCLAMDGLKVLAPGFEVDEKVKIEKLVSAIGGMLQTKASLDVSFVVVKNVLAAKYKV